MYVHVHVHVHVLCTWVCTSTTCTGIIISTSIIITSISTNIHTVCTCTCNLYSMYSTSTCINLQSIKQMFRYGCMYIPNYFTVLIFIVIIKEIKIIIYREKESLWTREENREAEGLQFHPKFISAIYINIITLS